MKYSKTILFLILLCFAALVHAEHKFTVTSASFKESGRIPEKYARADANMSPQLSWKNAPAGTKSFVITCIDIHPIASNWVHWMAINIPASVTSLPENASSQNMPSSALELKNSFQTFGYGGPNPPKGSGVHNYIFTVYALNVSGVEVAQSFFTEKQLLQLIGDKIIAQASITGKYSR